MAKRVCVIGGGISGLCVAFALRRSGTDVVLFEKSGSAGGNIKTEVRDGFLIEHGPNTALASRELLDLIDELSISDKIAPPNPNAKKRYIIRDGKLTALPLTILGLIGNKTFSATGKLRLLKEPFIRTRSKENESVSSFFERRLGREIVEYGVDPFISGIYAGDPQKLSIRHSFPRMFEAEREYGSLLIGGIFARGNKASKLPKGTPRSITFKNGMQTLTDALSTGLGGSVRTGTSVMSVEKLDPGGFRVRTDEAVENFDAVVICTPAHSAASMIERLDPALAKELTGIYYPPVAVVVSAFRHGRVGIDPDGFGFLVPAIEHREILGSLWTSSVFENRAPNGYHLFTTFIGGSRNPELARGTDEELAQIVKAELGEILKIAGEPVFVTVKRWERAIPQYNVGYETVVEAIEKFKRENSGLFFCTNFYNGISVGDCVKNSVVVTKEVLDHLDLNHNQWAKRSYNPDFR